MRKPEFFIVGAPKCGTTAMNDYLGQHPEIFMCPRKEVHFFGTDLKRKADSVTEKKYISLFSGTKSEKIIGESSVWYLYSQRAATEIKNYCHSARIIIMLRNPVDMLYSLYHQSLYNGNEDIDDFRTAIDAEEDRKRGLRIPKTAFFIDGLFYRQTAKYTEQVTRYLDVFGKRNVHIIIFDDFKNNTANVYKDTLRFLGVNETFQPDFRIINPNKYVRSKSLRNILFNPPKVVKSICEISLIRSLATEIRKKMKKANTSYRIRPPLDFEYMRQLQKEFTLEVQQLSEVIGMDLMHWCQDGN